MNKQTPDNITDEMFLTILDAKEAGKSFPDALSMFPAEDISEENVSVLRSLWEMHGDLMRSAHNVTPDTKLLSRTLDTLMCSPNVTMRVDGGSTGEGGNIPKNLFIRNLHLIMQMNWKLGAPIAVFALAVVAVVGMGVNKPSTKLAVNEVKTPEPALMDARGVVQNSPEDATAFAEGTASDFSMARSAKSVSAPTREVSGELDDLTASLSLEADGDMDLLSDTTADLSLLSADSQSINDFNTAYDETIF